MTKCDKCDAEMRYPDTNLLLGFNGDLCEYCFAKLLFNLEKAREDVINTFLYPDE